MSRHAPHLPLPSTDRTSAARPSVRRWSGSARAAAATAAGLSLLLAGCTTSDEDAPAEPTASAPAEAEAAPVAVELPAGPLGDHARWIVGQVSTDPLDDAETAAARFSQEMLDQVGADEILVGLESLRATGPWTPVAFDGSEAEAVMTIEDTTGTFLDVQLVVGADGLLAGLLLTPGTDPDRPAPSSWDELDERVDELGDVDAVVLVSRVAEADDPSQAPGERCEPVHSTGDVDEAMPVASIFKLYVLAAVAEAVEAGALTWDTPLTLTDDVRSLPSGTLQDQPTGTVVSVRDAAGAMIAISDNTAADLLVSTVGRDAVLATMTATGHSDPSVNTPFLTTRDVFRIGWAGAADAPAWDSLSETEQAAAVAALPGGPIAVDPAAVTTAVWEDGVDWFATATDLCAVHVALQDAAATATGGPVREILAANPGVEVDTAAWPYVGFKGGSTPGVVAGSWYAEDADGAAVVVSVQLASSDPATLPSLATFVDLSEAALTLAAE